MDNKKKIVKHTRYVVRVSTNGKTFNTLMGKVTRVAFDKQEDAVAYLHTVLNKMPGVLGVIATPEDYYVEE